MKKLTVSLIAIWGLLLISEKAWAWQANADAIINGSVNGNDRAIAVTVDRSGDVIAAGFTRNSGLGLNDFTVVKISGANGTELWRQVVNGAANGEDQALAVTSGAAGNVIAAGFITNVNTGRDF